jgi:hypothetical protein
VQCHPLCHFALWCIAADFVNWDFPLDEVGFSLSIVGATVPISKEIRSLDTGSTRQERPFLGNSYKTFCNVCTSTVAQVPRSEQHQQEQVTAPGAYTFAPALMLRSNPGT